MMARAQKQKGQERVRWSQGEDRRLVEYMQRHGETGRWTDVPRRAGLGRSGKSCRLRWTNYLRSDIKRGPFSEEEEATIMELQEQLGNKWTTIAKRLPGRTDTGIKNFWNNRLKKKISKKETPSLVNLTPLHQLLDTADLLTCAVNDLRDEVLKLHSDASFTWYPRHGHGFHPTDEELILTSLPPLPPLPPQTPSFHYQQAMEEQQVCPRNPDGIGFGPASIPDASFIPLPVSASLEPSKAYPVVEIVEPTPADQDFDYLLEELQRNWEPIDRFMDFTSSPDADGSQNIIN